MEDSKALMDTIGLEEDFSGHSLLLFILHDKWCLSIPMEDISAYSNIQGKISVFIEDCAHTWPLNLLFSPQFAEVCHCTSTKK